ncbi:MAG: MerR family transcriptional regulator [Deinococcota bacterium]
MKIGALAAQTQTPASTIRYYERIGLIPFVERTSKQRIYDDSMIWRINFINAAKATGFSLDEIHAFLQLADQGEQWRNHVKAKICDLDAKITQYQNMKDSLSHILENDCLDQGLEKFAHYQK